MTRLGRTHTLKTNVIAALEASFPNFEDFLDLTNDDGLVLDFPNAESRFGGIVVQMENNEIWIRSYLPYTACTVETIEELVFFITKVLDDELIVVVSTKNQKWVETKWYLDNENVVLQEEVENEVYSWSGKLDFSS